MNVSTAAGIPLSTELLRSYFDSLVNHFFKILPIRESGEASLPLYVKSLQMELYGCGNLVPAVGKSEYYLTLLSILQYMIDHPETPVCDIRREVFRSIGICNKLRDACADWGEEP